MSTAIQPGLKEPISWPKIAVVVLAGGRSSRMGQDKALLPDSHSDLGGTLLDRACALGEQLLGELGLDRRSLFISGDYPDYQDIGDRILGRGPLGGMHATLATLREGNSGYEFVLFLPVDMPTLESVTLRRLVDNRGSAQAVHYLGFELPALIRVSGEIEELLFARLDAAESDPAIRSVRAVLESLEARAIEASGEEMNEFLNLNTIDDLQDWRRMRR